MTVFDHAVHKNVLIQVLKDIYTDSSIGSALGFKGGTAAYLFYGLKRFSVDLDLDLLDDGRQDAVYERIAAILGDYGALREKRKKRYTLFFLLSYGEEARNIKVEISRRDLGSRYEVRSYLGIPMLVMVREDMFAHKLAAMMERIGKTNRDIYDVWYFLRNHWPVNREIVEKRSGMTFEKFLRRCADSIGKMSDRNILSGIGELLDEKQKAWAKTHLRKDTVFLLKAREKDGEQGAA